MTFEEFKHQINSIEHIPDNAQIKISRNMICINWNISTTYTLGNISETEIIPRIEYITLPQSYDAS